MTENLTGISGSMFAGKTDRVISFAVRAEIAGRVVQVFKPEMDLRWDLKDKIRSHSGAEFPATEVKKSIDILANLHNGIKLVLIDEAQFFDEEIVGVVKELLERDVEVVVAGLALDFRGEPFGSMPELLALSDKLEKLTAICTFSNNGDICGSDATRTQRIVNGEPAKYSDPIILIGAEESYTARCPSHHVVPGNPRIE